MKLADYVRLVSGLPYLAPLTYHCPGRAPFPIQVEPLEGRDCLKVKRSCILQCRGCGRHFRSDYD